MVVQSPDQQGKPPKSWGGQDGLVLACLSCLCLILWLTAITLKQISTALSVPAVRLCLPQSPDHQGKPSTSWGGQDGSVCLNSGERRMKRKGWTVLPLFVSVWLTVSLALSNRLQHCFAVSAVRLWKTKAPVQQVILPSHGGGSGHVCLSCFKLN